MDWHSSFQKTIFGTLAMAMSTYISVWKPEGQRQIGLLGALSDSLFLGLLLGLLVGGLLVFGWGMWDSYREKGHGLLHSALTVICGLALFMLQQLASLPEKGAYLSTMVALLSGIAVTIALETRKTASPRVET